MKDLYNKLEKIQEQTTAWLKFGIASPILLLITVLALYNIVNTSISFVLIISWTMFFCSSLIWWIWVIKVLTEMSRIFVIVLSITAETKADIENVKTDLKITSNL